MALDLSRIDALTREVLEGEARRRGIRSPEFRTRAELIRLILRSQYGERMSIPRELLAQGAKTVAQARGLLGEVVGAALAGLPEPLGALARLRSRWPLPASRPRSEAPPPVRVESAAPPSEPATPSEPPQPSEPATPSEPPQPSTSSQRPSAAPIGAWSAPPPPPRPSLEPATRTFVEEPIRTRSMARLLASQGHRERGLAIYEELLARNSEDGGLRAEAEALRRGEPVTEPRLSAPAQAPESHAPLPDGGDRLWCEGDPQAGLRLRWQLTEQGQERARAVLGHHGELAIRVVAIQPDSTDVVRSEITEHGPVSARGEWIAPSLLTATRCFAAVGLRDGDRFVAVVHARPPAT